MKFKFLMEVTTLMEMQVDAPDLHQAQEIANYTDINDWTSVEDTNREIISITEINDVNI